MANSLRIPATFDVADLTHADLEKKDAELRALAKGGDMTTRPYFNEEIARLAATDLADELIKNGSIQADERADVIAQIAKHGRTFEDGYQLARKLEQYCCWDVDLDLATDLDDFGNFARNHIRRAQEKWAQETNQQPAFSDGAVVRLKGGETGVITGVYEFGAAQYVIAVDQDFAGHRVVNFEDVSAIAAAEGGR